MGLRLFVLLFAPLMLATGCLSAPHAQIYVSPNGNDAWSGRSATANAKGTDGPVATLDGARNAVLDLKKSGHAKGNAIHIAIREGEYRLSRTVVFGPDDSGNAEQPIIYEAYPGEWPVFQFLGPDS